MDGNGRWAKQRGLPRTIGHKWGVDRVRKILKEAKKMGIKILTIFAFSTENWNRPKAEIKLLFSYLESFLKNELNEFMREDTRFIVIGRRDRLNAKLIGLIEHAEKVTENNRSFTVNFAIDYGGRWDIAQAARSIAVDAQRGVLRCEDIDETVVNRYLALSQQPSPDLLIRTSGELRISNFLLWQCAYSELYFPNVYWPDFSSRELGKAIEEYSRRERKYGKIHE